MSRHAPIQDGDTFTIWLIYSQCATGTYIEGTYTSKVQAEADMRWHKENDRDNSTHWIRELQTETHKTLC